MPPPGHKRSMDGLIPRGPPEEPLWAKKGSFRTSPKPPKHPKSMFWVFFRTTSQTGKLSDDCVRKRPFWAFQIGPKRGPFFVQKWTLQMTHFRGPFWVLYLGIRRNTALNPRVCLEWAFVTRITPTWIKWRVVIWGVTPWWVAIWPTIGG